MEQPVDVQGVGRQRQRRFGVADAVLTVVGVGVGGGDEGRNVAAGLAGQVVVDRLEVASARAGDRLVDVAGAAVVGGQRQGQS